MTPTANSSNEIYQKALDIAQQFLGPSATRFINRQIEQHLEKKPEELTDDDVSKLAQWVKTSAALITNQKIAEDFSEKIAKIT